MKIIFKNGEVFDTRPYLELKNGLYLTSPQIREQLVKLHHPDKHQEYINHISKFNKTFDHVTRYLQENKKR